MKPRCFKPRFWLGLAIAATVLVVPTTAQAENVVPNPGFEIAECPTPNGTAQVCGWHTGEKMGRDTFNPHSGEAGMVLTCREWSGYSCFTGYAEAASDCVPITPATHSASFWYRQTGLTWLGGVALMAEFYSSPACHGFVSREFFSADASFDSEWHKVTGSLSGGGAYAYFSLQVGWCDFLCSASFWFDDVYVEGAGSTRTRQTPPHTSFTRTKKESKTCGCPAGRYHETRQVRAFQRDERRVRFRLQLPVVV